MVTFSMRDGTGAAHPEQARRQLTAPARAPQGRRTAKN
jgi:hypothetical protein